MFAEFEIFEDDQGEHRWHLKAGNGEIVCQSEGYQTEDGARRGMVAMTRAAVEALVLVNPSAIRHVVTDSPEEKK